MVFVFFVAFVPMIAGFVLLYQSRLAEGLENLLDGKFSGLSGREGNADPLDGLGGWLGRGGTLPVHLVLQDHSRRDGIVCDAVDEDQ